MTLEALLPRLEFACGIEDAIRREIHRDPERIRAWRRKRIRGSRSSSASAPPGR